MHDRWWICEERGGGGKAMFYRTFWENFGRENQFFLFTLFRLSSRSPISRAYYVIYVHFASIVCNPLTLTGGTLIKNNMDVAAVKKLKVSPFVVGRCLKAQSEVLLGTC